MKLLGKGGGGRAVCARVSLLSTKAAQGKRRRPTGASLTEAGGGSLLTFSKFLDLLVKT